MTDVYRDPVPDARRVEHTAALFGLHFPMRLEPAVFSLASRLSPDYKGAYWQFYTLSNGGFYMAPQSEGAFVVHAENGFEGMLSGDALGITVCLYAYSHLSFAWDDDFGQTCAAQYHLLREWMLGHAEVGAVLGAID